MDCGTPGFPVLHYFPEFAQTHVHLVDAIQPSYPLWPTSHPALNLSQHQGLYQWVSSLRQVAKYWSFSSSISLSNGYSGLISFRIDWVDLLAVQRTLKSLLQHHSSKASILWCSFSHLYMITRKTIALTVQTFVSQVMSLFFNMLSKSVIALLPMSKHLLISWLRSPSAVILDPKKIKSATVSTVSPSICHEVMGLDAMILVFWMLSFKPTFSLSSFTFLIFLPVILIPACASSSLAFHIMYSAYKWNQHCSRCPKGTTSSPPICPSTASWLYHINSLRSLSKLIRELVNDQKIQALF